MHQRITHVPPVFAPEILSLHLVFFANNDLEVELSRRIVLSIIPDKKNKIIL